MSQLIVVRHAQASFLEDDYDRLSEKGIEQSRRLGEFWLRQHALFDRVYVGPRRRHAETAEHAGRVLAAAGVAWPAAVVMPELDEYDADGVIQKGLPALLEAHEHIRKLHEDFLAATDRADQHCRFQRMYEVVIGMWSRGDFELEGVEPWVAFCRRAHEGFDRIVAEAPTGSRIVAFTSGGPAGIAAARAVGAAGHTTLELAWMVRNGAYSEFLFSGDRFTLSSFNAYPHLDDPDLVTYR